MKILDTDRIDAIQVQFKKGIFEDDFPDKGMKAWLTDVQFDEAHCCYELFFDFSEFENHNFKYFKEVYYPNQHTGTDKQKYTAIQAGYYNPKYGVFFGDLKNTTEFNEGLINEYLKVIEMVNID